MLCFVFYYDESGLYLRLLMFGSFGYETIFLFKGFTCSKFFLREKVSETLKKPRKNKKLQRNIKNFERLIVHLFQKGSNNLAKSYRRLM